MKKSLPILLLCGLLYACRSDPSPDGSGIRPLYQAPRPAARPAKGGCTGSARCSVCKNCSRCKHCARKGGHCGVCRTVRKRKKS